MKIIGRSIYPPLNWEATQLEKLIPLEYTLRSRDSQSLAKVVDQRILRFVTTKIT